MLKRREVSRIEGFSDAVFGFALTLLVVSLEVPADFEELKLIFRGFPAFAATFAIVSWIWYEHYAFFRRFGPEDGFTIFLNAVLLFVVLFYVFPLKFTFNRIIGLEGGFGDLGGDNARLLHTAYATGFILIFGVLTLLHWNVHRRRDQLGLDVRLRFEATSGARTHLASVAVGVVSFVAGLTVPDRLLWLPGLIFAMLGPVHFVNGVIRERQRKRLQTLPSSTPGPP